MINRLLKKLLINYCSLILILIIDIIVDFNPFIVYRGFFAKDASLMHPLKVETIKWKVLLSLAAIVPAIIIVLVEVALRMYDVDKVFVKISEKIVIPKFVYLMLQNLFNHWFILLVTFFLTDFIKFRVGRLRPHFLTVCQANRTFMINATEQTFIDIPDVCLGNPQQIITARQSFPSGHSSMTSSAATSTLIFLYYRLWQRVPAFRFPLQVLTMFGISLVAYVATSRLVDFWHHPTDVLCGCLLGFIVAVVIWYFHHKDNLVNGDISCSGEVYSEHIGPLAGTSVATSRVSMN